MNCIRPFFLSSLLAVSLALPVFSVEKGEVSIQAAPATESTTEAAPAGVRPPATEETAPKSPLKKTWIKVGAGRSDFLVFARPDAGFTGHLGLGDDVVIMGTQGAVLSKDHQKPVLHDGAVLITCRRGNVKLTTKIATISIPQGATVLIDRVPSTYSVKVAVVSGSAAQEVLAGSKRGHQSFGLKPGQEVTFSEATRDAAVVNFNRNALRPEVAQLVSAGRMTTTPVRILGEEGSEFRCSGPDAVFLRSGEIFLQVPDKLVIQTPVADGVGGKGAVIDIDADAEYMRMKAFSGPGHATVVAHDRTLNVSPGEEYMVCSHEIGDADLYTADGVGRRKEDKLKIEDKPVPMWGARTDYSIVSFFNAAPYVQPLKRSQDPQDKVMLDKILKTAASLFTVTQGRGVYRSVSRISRKRTSPGNQHQSGGSA